MSTVISKDICYLEQSNSIAIVTRYLGDFVSIKLSDSAYLVFLKKEIKEMNIEILENIYQFKGAIHD